MAEYTPDLGVNLASVQMYDKDFAGGDGDLLKTRIKDAASRVDLNPGLLAATLFAEDKVSSYTKKSGEVKGWWIGVDDYKERRAAIERRVPAARTLKPTRYTTETNENGRVISDVPVFNAPDAVLATAVYLKYGELLARDTFKGFGGSFDRMPVEYQFALTRYAMNSGPHAMKQRVMETLHNKDILQYNSGTLKNGLEQFNRHHPGRAATVHVAQAIHLSQRVFGIYPSGGSESLMFFR